MIRKKKKKYNILIDYLRIDPLKCGKQIMITKAVQLMFVSCLCQSVLRNKPFVFSE